MAATSITGSSSGEYLPLFEVADNRPEVLTDSTWVTHIFWGMDGALFMTGNETMPWHGISIRRLIREIPRSLGVPGRHAVVEEGLRRLEKTPAPRSKIRPRSSGR